MADGERHLGDLGRQFPEGSEHYFSASKRGDVVFASSAGTTHCIRQAGSRGSGHVSAADGAILAPMPGKVIAVDVAAGEAVTKGQRLLVLEAMKMEHALTAPFDGTVAELAVAEGSQVQVEALLARVERAAE
jgi:3-methylcrotonyl-CoA carboxylase alpha subunit